MSLARLTVLLLIADARLREIYVSRLEKAGWEVAAAMNLLDAERRAVQLRPKVFVVDQAYLDSPAANFKRFKALPTLHQAKLVVICKFLEADILKQLLTLGADEVMMTTHLNPQSLLRRLRQLTDMSEL